jgi:hypothetical protein
LIKPFTSFTCKVQGSDGFAAALAPVLPLQQLRHAARSSGHAALRWQPFASFQLPPPVPHLLARVLARYEHPIGEPLQIDQLLGLSQLLGVVLKPKGRGWG